MENAANVAVVTHSSTASTYCRALLSRMRVAPVMKPLRYQNRREVAEQPISDFVDFGQWGRPNWRPCTAARGFTLRATWTR